MRRQIGYGVAGALGVAAVMSLVALGRHPYGYYTSVRWAICVAGLVGGVSLYRTDRWLALVIIVGAIVFNPLAPLRLSRDVWSLLNIGAAVACGAGAVAVSERSRRKQP